MESIGYVYECKQRGRLMQGHEVLRSVIWRPRRAIDRFQSESEGLRTSRVNGIIPSPSPKAEDQCPISRPSEVERMNCLLLNLFYSRLSTDWMKPVHTGKGNLLGTFSDFMLISSINTLTNIPRIIFHQVFGHPVA